MDSMLEGTWATQEETLLSQRELEQLRRQQEQAQGQGADGGEGAGEDDEAPLVGTGRKRR